MSLGWAFDTLAHPEGAPRVEVAAVASASEAGIVEPGGPKRVQVVGDRSDGRASSVTPGITQSRSTPRRSIIVSTILPVACADETVSPHCECLPYDATAPPSSL